MIKKAADLDLSFKLVKCISKIIPLDVFLSKRATRSIVEGETKFLGKLIDVNLNATKRAAGIWMKAHLAGCCCLSSFVGE